MRLAIEIIYNKKNSFTCQKKEKELEINGENLTLDLIKKQYPKGSSQIFGISVELNNEIKQLTIDGFSFLEIQNSYDNKNLKLTINNIKNLLVLRNITAHNLIINNCQTLLLNSELKILKVDLKNVFKANDTKRPLKFYSFSTKIEQLQFFKTQQLIKLSASNIGRFVIEPQTEKINNLIMRSNCKIEQFNPVTKIIVLKIIKSTINNLIFYPQSEIKNIELKYQIIKDVYNCKTDTICNKNSLNTWNLLMNSANNDNNTQLYSEANYNYMEQKRKKLNDFPLKISYKLMDLLCGYGYKPLNTIIATFIIWLFFGLIYFYLTFYLNAGISLPANQSLTKVDVIIYSLYYSAITLTTIGYGDIVPSGQFIKLLSGIEAAIGISLFSIFIFALTERFGNFK